MKDVFAWFIIRDIEIKNEVDFNLYASRKGFEVMHTLSFDRFMKQLRDDRKVFEYKMRNDMMEVV